MKKQPKLFWCKSCLNGSHRPRIGFDKNRGVCNACLHHEDKFNRVIDWKERKKRFEELCFKFKRDDDYFSVIIPASGGKDSSYIAHKIKTEYGVDTKFGVKPLLVSCRPLIPTRMGERNLENLILSGFDHIRLSCNPEEIRIGSKIGFIEQGRPWHVFDSMISAAISKLALQMDIRFLLFAEEGEVEYGGKNDPPEKFDTDYLLNAYYCGHDPTRYGYWWKMPTQKELNSLFITHWSKFFDFDGEVHAKYCQEKLGLEMLVGGHIGSFTNYDSLDCYMRDLHIFLSFTKYGQGRCVQAVCTEVRRGRMSRKQAVDVCKKLDGQFPMEFLPSYLDYYEMSEKEFWEVIDRWVDYSILYKTGVPEKPYALKDEYAEYNVFMPDDCDGVNFERGRFSSV